MKLLSPVVALHIYKSTTQPCIECCCNACGGAPSQYLEMLDKLQKWMYDCWSLTAASPDSALKCSQLKSFLLALLW